MEMTQWLDMDLRQPTSVAKFKMNCSWLKTSKATACFFKYPSPELCLTMSLHNTRVGMSFQAVREDLWEDKW